VSTNFGEAQIAKNINEAEQKMARKNLAIQPTIEISPGFRFNVFVSKDIVVERYEA
jgi:type IV secretory pathway VirB10-like protein